MGFNSGFKKLTCPLVYCPNAPLMKLVYRLCSHCSRRLPPEWLPCTGK